jgi:cell division protein FtsB
VDKSAAQVKSLNETIARQTGQIATLEKLRIDDNTKQGNAIANLQIEKGNVETARDTARKIAFYLGVICFGLIVFIVVYWLLKLKGFVK